MLVSLTVFSMQLVSESLYAGWSRAAENSEMFICGWDYCGLCSMFDMEWSCTEVGCQERCLRGAQALPAAPQQ
jgi:hypothetical protein